MKIYIGPYKNWIGPYQIADLFKYLGASEDRCYKIGEWLSETPLMRLCTWIESKKKRKVKIKIHKYDTWGMDSTLAYIILPMLKQLKETKHGSPFVDDEDVPDNLKSTSAAPKENQWDIDDNHHLRWEYVMDQMIWSFEQIHPDYDWEAQYHTGEIDIKFESDEASAIEGEQLYTLVRGPNDTHVFDSDGYKKHSEKIDQGLRLFGKYYRGLWD